MNKSLLLLLMTLTSGCTTYKSKKMEHTISTEELKNTREFFNGLGRVYKPDDEVKQIKDTISGIVSYTFIPPNANNNRLLLYAHGGSFSLGGIESHMAMMTHLAKATQTKIIFVEYGLAPENPFPKGVNDFFAVYKSVMGNMRGKKVFLGGDSAGGGIVISTIARMQDDKIQMPDGIILISPWLDLSCNSETYTLNKERDSILNKEELLKYANLYIGNSNLKSASPSNESFRSFPPNLVAVGKDEVLLQDSRDFNGKVKIVQHKSSLLEFESVTHVWPLTDINSEPTNRLFLEITNFLNNETN